jgi:hypothetical protein
MLSILLIALAAMFKAVADTVQHHFGASIFFRLPKKWWKYFDPDISWQAIPFLPLTKYRPDCWHIANSLMQACFLLAIFCYKPTGFGRVMDFVMCSLMVVMVFNLFYNRILIRK